MSGSGGSGGGGSGGGGGSPPTPRPMPTHLREQTAHAAALEPKIHKLQALHETATSTHNLAQLLITIRRPGWTTPQEAELVHALVDTLTHQMSGIVQTQQALSAAAEKIGQEQS